jgi:hypothetical protein
MRGAAGLGMLGPLAFAAPAARAQDAEETPDYSGHPAVGVWIEGSGPTFAYSVIHADGTSMYYNPWTSYFPGGSDPKLPVWGFGVWRPTGERTVEGVMHVAWGDTSVTTQMTFWSRSIDSEDPDQGGVEYRERAVDAAGNVLVEDQGIAYSRRMRWEPFEEPATPEATPGA